MNEQKPSKRLREIMYLGGPWHSRVEDILDEHDVELRRLEAVRRSPPHWQEATIPPDSTVEQLPPAPTSIEEEARVIAERMVQPPASWSMPFHSRLMTHDEEVPGYVTYFNSDHPEEIINARACIASALVAFATKMLTGQLNEKIKECERIRNSEKFVVRDLVACRRLIAGLETRLEVSRQSCGSLCSQLIASRAECGRLKERLDTIKRHLNQWNEASTNAVANRAVSDAHNEVNK